MFKLLTVLSLVSLCLSASVPSNENAVPIVAIKNDVEPDGTFHFSYESGDGTKVHEEGTIKAGPKPEEPIESVQGGYEFNSPEGQKISLQYTADENGYQPQSEDLPIAPPVPELIIKALKYIEAHPPPKEVL